MDTLAEKYAAYVSRLTYDDLPENVVHKAVLLFLDYLGCCIGGRTCPAALKLLETVPGFGQGNSAVVGRSVRAHPWTAAMINGTAAHYLDMDDGHKPSISHPAVAIFPALSALSEGFSGREFITAAVAGYEVMCRLGAAMQPDHQSKLGFHTTGTCGTVGAAVACSKLLGLTETKISNAIGVATLQASGLLEVMSSGVMSKPFHAGKAASGGLLAALLAARDMEAPATSLEGDKGFLNAMGGHWNADKLTEGLGTEYQTLGAYFKFHAACGLCHSSADALRSLLQEYDLVPEDVESVELQVQSYAADVVGVPKNMRQGTEMKFSLPYSSAIILLYGDLLPMRFTDKYLFDEKVRELAARIRVQPSAEMDQTFPKLRSSRAVIMLHDGRVLQKRVDAARGHPENPPEDKELFEKFKTLAEDMHGKETDRILNEIMMIPCRESVFPLINEVLAPRS